MIKNERKYPNCPGKCPVLSCPAGQDRSEIFVLSCRAAGQTMTGQQDRTGQKKLSCAQLCCENVLMANLRHFQKFYIFFLE